MNLFKTCMAMGLIAPFVIAEVRATPAPHSHSRNLTSRNDPNHNSHCYVKCRRDYLSPHPEDMCHIKKEQALATDYDLYCPANDLQLNCQTSCWSPGRFGAREVPLKNKGFSREDTNVQNTFKKALANYEQHHNTIIEPGDVLQNGTTPILPTCISQHVANQDFDPSWIHLLHMGSQLFPCSCGDWAGNGTQAFLHASGFGLDSHVRVSHNIDRLFLGTCPNNLRNTWPATRFLNFCALNISFPINHSHRMQSHANVLCETIKAEIADMNEPDGNRHFCKFSEHARTLFKSEDSYVGFIPATNTFMKSHGRLCVEDWNEHERYVSPMVEYHMSEYNYDKKSGKKSVAGSMGEGRKIEELKGDNKAIPACEEKDGKCVGADGWDGKDGWDILISDAFSEKAAQT